MLKINNIMKQEVKMGDSIFNEGTDVISMATNVLIGIVEESELSEMDLRDAELLKDACLQFLEAYAEKIES